MRRLTIFSDSQDPASLAASETPVSITVPAPHNTESVRVVILAQEGGQVGALEVEHKELKKALRKARQPNRNSSSARERIPLAVQARGPDLACREDETSIVHV